MNFFGGASEAEALFSFGASMEWLEPRRATTGARTKLAATQKRRLEAGATKSYSERRARAASTLAARMAGMALAVRAATRIRAAEMISGVAPGIWSSVVYLAIRRTTAKPAAVPTVTPIRAMTKPSLRTPERMLRGLAPRARRMPNSWRRPLTEKARTPATPTIEMSRARLANPPKTMALRRSGAMTSARTSSRVLARSTG